jgi:hypothetical protein
MPALDEPLTRVEFAERLVGRFQDDVQSWTPRHDAEDVVAWANFIFELIVKIDIWIQEYFLVHGTQFDLELHEKPRKLLRYWLDACRKMIGRVEASQGEVSGLEALRRNIRQAEASLTPDDESFDSDELAVLRDEAIECHRAGLTEPLWDDERDQ